MKLITLIYSEVFLKLTMYIAAIVTMAPTSCTGVKVSPRYRNPKIEANIGVKNVSELSLVKLPLVAL